MQAFRSVVIETRPRLTFMRVLLCGCLLAPLIGESGARRTYRRFALSIRRVRADWSDDSRSIEFWDELFLHGLG